MRSSPFTFVMLIVVSTAAGQQTSSQPATPAEAARILDLVAFPLMGEADKPGSQSLANLTYEAKATIAAALEHHRKALLAKKWTELDGTQATEQYASATFRHGDYRLSLSIFPTVMPGQVMINLINHGNIDTAKLPTPPGVTPFYKTPVSTAYLAAGTLDETRGAVRELLTAQGWEPYGVAGDVVFYKQNAVRLTARVAEAPAQDGKTLIDYSTALMSADLPAPENAERVQYSDGPTQVSVDLPGSLQDAAEYYRKALGERGWQPTTEQPIQEKFEQFWIFRNDAKDLIEIQLREVEGKSRLLVRYRTAAQEAELERRVEESRKAKK